MAHIKKTRNKSMMARIYGLFTIKTDYFVPLNIMIMQNTHQSTYQTKCVLNFDLKGSRESRKSKGTMTSAQHEQLMNAKSEKQFF